jgi:hypothetical protein
MSALAPVITSDDKIGSGPSVGHANITKTVTRTAYGLLSSEYRYLAIATASLLTEQDQKDYASAVVLKLSVTAMVSTGNGFLGIYVCASGARRPTDSTMFSMPGLQVLPRDATTDSVHHFEFGAAELRSCELDLLAEPIRRGHPKFVAVWLGEPTTTQHANLGTFIVKATIGLGGDGSGIADAGDDNGL